MRHPWAVELMEVRKPGARELETPRRDDGVPLEEADLPFRMAIHAYSVMDSYIYGFALLERTLPFETPEEDRPSRGSESQPVIAEEHPIPADEYPHIFEIVAGIRHVGLR